MTIVYVVTTGAYSDYQIVKVFSTRGRAEAFVGGAPAYDIEEWELDARPSERVVSYHHCHLYVDDGSIHTTDRSAEVSDLAPRECQVDIKQGWHDRWIVSVKSPVSAEHAFKVAIEKRQEWLRTKELPA